LPSVPLHHCSTLTAKVVPSNAGYGGSRKIAEKPRDKRSLVACHRDSDRVISHILEKFLKDDPRATAFANASTILDMTTPVVSFEDVSLALDDKVVLRDVSLSLPAGHMTFLLGPSGAGKSVVLKLILGLLKPDSGAIRLNGERIDRLNEEELTRVRGDIGMLFQESALFDSLTVAENVGYRLFEETDMPEDQVLRRVQEVLGFIGMSEFLDRMPSELSGGQRRRVAIARAMAARPHLLLFDDPTSGLDPMMAKTVDDEVVKLRDLEHVTSIVVTHQLPDAFYIASHEAVRRDGQLAVVPTDHDQLEETEFIMLRDGRIYFEGSAAELRGSTDPYLEAYLSGWVPPLPVY
jgi:phospholipid/cholesterol/gamma-HCH transport system ATP-binding protein